MGLRCWMYQVMAQPLSTIYRRAPTRSNTHRIHSKMENLFKELGDCGKLACGIGSNMSGTLGDVVVAESWTSEEVGAWLEQVGCNQYAEKFATADMDGMALAGLLRLSAKEPAYCHDLLRADFGIDSIGHRLRLIEELHRLFV